MSSPPNFYEVLHVSPDASAAQIKAAFRARAKATHPDLQVVDPTAGSAADDSRFKLVQSAYEVLGNAGSRAAYDASLRAAKRGSGGGGGVEDFAAAWAWRAECVLFSRLPACAPASEAAAPQERGGERAAARAARGGAGAA